MEAVLQRMNSFVKPDRITDSIFCTPSHSFSSFNSTVHIHPCNSRMTVKNDKSKNMRTFKVSARLSDSETKENAKSSTGIPNKHLSNLGGIVTDESVPEGHAGLHGFLYGDSGADVHDSNEDAYRPKEGEDDGQVLLPLEGYVSSRSRRKLAAVYSIYDSEEKLQYVGYSRNVILSLKGHKNIHGENICCFVKVKVYTESSLITRTKLEEERQAWLSNASFVPRGNDSDVHLWEGPNGPGTAAMNEEERNAYEEKKLKMRKAMGENLHDEVEGEDEDSKQRRLKLLQATEGDDWSSVIDGQTKQTISNKSVTKPAVIGSETTEEIPNQIVSPFMRPGFTEPTETETEKEIEMEFTVATVDRTLDEVRPYLIADGGNVEVVAVENGIVYLRLQGACGTCPSSTATMKMGLEAAIRKKFGDRVKDVMQVDKIDTKASIVGVNAHLDMLRPAITNFGGSVEVVSVDNLRGVCEVKFKGPPPIGMGIQAAIKDKFPDVRVVKLVDF